MSEPAGQLWTYTHADLLSWESLKRYELYEGQPVLHPSPSGRHQLVQMELCRQIANYLIGKTCKVYPAPFDVRLFEREEDTPWTVNTVVQPDISVICDRSKTDSHGCKGAPDMVIEILSASTAQYDRRVKFDLYQRAGVQEYWIVDPESRVVSVYLLEDGAYHGAVTYSAGAQVPVGILEECSVDLTPVFQED